MITNLHMWFKHQFEISRAGVGNNVLTMEGIRGFAVFLVFLVHYSSLSMPWIAANSPILSWAEALHSIGNAGVDLFFVLSGYLIYGSLISRQQPFLEFLKRRITRIYPAFTAVFLLYLLLSLLFPAENKIPDDGALLYLLQNFLLLPGIFAIEPMITVAWSLSYEVFFYLALPVVVTAMRFRSLSAERRVLYVAFIAFFTAFWCTKYDSHLRLLMFIAGIFLYESVSSGKVRPPLSVTGSEALFIGIVAMIFPVSGAIKVWFLFTSFYLFCLSCFLRPDEWLARCFTWTPLRWLGNMSYSYYLLHGLSLKAIFLFLVKVTPPNQLSSGVFLLFLLPAAFFLTLFPTTMLFLLVERPLSLPRIKRHGQERQIESQAATFLPGKL